MSEAVEESIAAKAEQIRAKFRELLDKTKKGNPQPKDVAALAELLNGNKSLELWRDVFSAAQYAERAVIENSSSVAGVKEMLETPLVIVEAGTWLQRSAVARRVRKLSRNTPALQFNIAASGGQQVNLGRFSR
jgi:hypothetical protein